MKISLPQFNPILCKGKLRNKNRTFQNAKQRMKTKKLTPYFQGNLGRLKLGIARK